jgi:hypothetical protein
MIIQLPQKLTTMLLKLNWKLETAILTAMDKKDGYLQMLKICKEQKLSPSEVFPYIYDYKEFEEFEGITYDNTIQKENYNLILPYMALTKRRFKLRKNFKFQLP